MCFLYSLYIQQSGVVRGHFQFVLHNESVFIYCTHREMTEPEIHLAASFASCKQNTCEQTI